MNSKINKDEKDKTLYRNQHSHGCVWFSIMQRYGYSFWQRFPTGVIGDERFARNNARWHGHFAYRRYAANPIPI